MSLCQQVRPYERVRGETQRVKERLERELTEQIRHHQNLAGAGRRKMYRHILETFADIPIQQGKKRRVGVTGEIYMKFCALGNHDLERFLEGRGCGNVLVPQPFGCLVSHVSGRGILMTLRKRYPGVNIQTIKYDYDSSDTLLESRILMELGNVCI
ncbi:MAG: hypothetical protein NC121_15335 [Blautia sp.]|nr:hypothetical protein [Blautia sp.]